MVKITIDTEKDEWEDINTQIIEMETQELLSIYDLFAKNPTLFVSVSNELDFRLRHTERGLATKNEIQEISERLNKEIE